MQSHERRVWWKEAVVYQVYPRSFMDSNGDGIGDLPGIQSKLDYLQDLGITVIWLSPIYASPNDDNGYDISDYRRIMDDFGTMSDFDQLLDGIHARGMKLVMDLVVNHTSDEHPWFVAARSSKGNPYRDYYYWRPGKEGKAPNNWASYFSGSAWQFDALTEEYYLHLFSKKQPDLNWANPKVRDEIYDMMSWWLDKGVDGFRMDVINAIAKANGLPDAPNPDNCPYVWAGQFFLSQPLSHDYLQEMNEKVLSKYDILTVGETGGITTNQALLYAGEDKHELNMVFQFEHVDLDGGLGDKWSHKAWRLADLKQIMSKWQTDLYGKAWGSLYLNNHDQPRSVSRFGEDGVYRVESAKMLATFIHFMQGTPYIYQGEEIGMTNVAFESIDDYRDVEIRNMWRERVLEGGEDADKALRMIHRKGRDNARTPMQWDDSPNGGFSKGTPWIRVNANYQKINVKQAMSDNDSIYAYYKQIIALRKQHPIVVYGSYQLLLADHPEIYAYQRTLDDERWLVVLNFSGNHPTFEPPADLQGHRVERIVGNYEDNWAHRTLQAFALRPFEARVYRLT